jgi:uncharacterized protein
VAISGDRDLATFLAINEECVDQLWPSSPDEMRALLRVAYYARTFDQGTAMIIAFDQTAPYDSPNFHWFVQRYPRFVYVDRVAVTQNARGRGLARRIYEELFARARADGHTIVCAEIYSDPPNPVSDAFHEAMGFEEIGRAFLPDRGKSVRYLVRPL